MIVISQTTFALLVLLAVAPLALARSSPQTPLPVLGRLLHLLSSLDGFFYPLVLGPLYLSLGPWFIGEVLTGSIGIISGR